MLSFNIFDVLKFVARRNPNLTRVSFSNTEHVQTVLPQLERKTVIIRIGRSDAHGVDSPVIVRELYSLHDDGIISGVIPVPKLLHWSDRNFREQPLPPIHVRGSPVTVDTANVDITFFRHFTDDSLKEFRGDIVSIDEQRKFLFQNVLLCKGFLDDGFY